MLLRRPSDTAPAAAERVRRLLSPGAAGWVPSEEDDQRGVVVAEPPADDTAGPPQTSSAAAPPLARSWSPDTVSPDGALADRPPGPVPQQPPVDASPSGSSPRHRLPAVLAGGRVDPGRRGAVALVVAALLAALVTGVVLLHGRPQEVAAPDVVRTGSPLPRTSAASAAPSAPPPTEVVVAVAGKVVQPGLVRLPAGSRVDDAVRAAGGPLPGAGTGLLNLARTLVDGEQVLVGVDPPPGAAAAGPAPAPAPGARAAGRGPLDLNQATVADLDALPGIGPVLAQRIVDWRSEHGRFASVEQLREVTGIGESKYADLEAEVTVP